MSQKKAFVALYLFILSLAGGGIQAQQDSDRFEINKQLEIFNALIKEMELFYVDSIEIEKTVKNGIDAMLRRLDPYTEYIPEQKVENLSFITTGEYGGIGALIRQFDGEGVMVAEPYEGTPALEAGLKAGDHILAIDTTDVSKANTSRVSELLKGVPNSKLTLTIQRPGEKKSRKIPITRKKVEIKQVPYYGVIKEGTGYIALTGFTDKSASQVKKALEELKKEDQIERLILDLRGNGGGILDAAVQIVNLFVPKGKEVLSTRGKVKQWDRIYRTAIEPIDTVMPIAVLINGGSASSSEIVAGALQDMDRAILIGQRSYGKGLVQSARELPYNGKLKITSSRYYIPSGRCIQAMDYSHRKADGTIGMIPDSLTSTFYTSNGRPVKDGGGIRPDIEVTLPKTPAMLLYLDMDKIFFDYITQWTQAHESIGPIEQFTYSDDDYEIFKKTLQEKSFTYDRQSEKALKELKEIATFEGFLDGDSTALKILEEKLTPNLERDLERYKKQIKKIISTEIVKRYYYQKGEIIESLKEDEVLAKAVETLADEALYKQTLSKSVKEEE